MGSDKEIERLRAVNAELLAALTTLASLYDDDTLRDFLAYCDGPLRAAIGPHSKSALEAALSAAREAIAKATSHDGGDALQSPHRPPTGN